jgi:hypothetical protein
MIEASVEEVLARWNPLADHIRPELTLKARIVRLYLDKRWRSASVREIAESLPEQNDAHEESITNALAHIARGRSAFDGRIDRALFDFEGSAQYRIIEGIDEFDALNRLVYPFHVQRIFEIIQEKLNLAVRTAEDRRATHKKFLEVLEKKPQLVIKIDSLSRSLELDLPD